MNKTHKHVFLSLLGLIIITMPFSANANAWAILSFTLWNVWLRYSNKEVPDSSELRNYCIFALLYCLVLLLGLINTANLQQGIKLFEARYPIILFPILAFLTGALWKREWIEKVLILFSVTSIACGLITQGSLLIDLSREGRSYSDFFYWRYSNMELSYRIGMHPTYLSMFALLSISIIYKLWICNRFRFWTFIGGYLGIAYLTVFVLHLASKISLLVLGVLLIMIGIDAFRRFRFRFLLAMVPIAVVLVMLFNLELFALKSRFESSYTTGIVNAVFSDTQAIDPDDHRSIAWRKSLDIIKDNVIFGVGTGDVMDELYVTYRPESNANFLIEKEIDSHNQFLEALLRNGLFGLAALLILYYWGFQKRGWNQLLYLSFIVIITTVSITENILDRQKGAVFFGVINTLLFIYCAAERQDKPANTQG